MKLSKKIIATIMVITLLASTLAISGMFGASAEDKVLLAFNEEGSYSVVGHQDTLSTDSTMKVTRVLAADEGYFNSGNSLKISYPAGETQAWRWTTIGIADLVTNGLTSNATGIKFWAKAEAGTSVSISEIGVSSKTDGVSKKKSNVSITDVGTWYDLPFSTLGIASGEDVSTYKYFSIRVLMNVVTGKTFYLDDITLYGTSDVTPTTSVTTVPVPTTTTVTGPTTTTVPVPTTTTVTGPTTTTITNPTTTTITNPTTTTVTSATTTTVTAPTTTTVTSPTTTVTSATTTTVTDPTTITTPTTTKDPTITTTSAATTTTTPATTTTEATTEEITDPDISPEMEAFLNSLGDVIMIDFKSETFTDEEISAMQAFIAAYDALSEEEKANLGIAEIDEILDTVNAVLDETNPTDATTTTKQADTTTTTSTKNPDTNGMAPFGILVLAIAAAGVLVGTKKRK